MKNNPLSVIEVLEKLKDQVQAKKEGTFEECVRLGLNSFNNYFNYTIRNWLNLFPPDSYDKSGALYWSGTKRCPNYIEFDANKEIHLDYIMAYANIIALSFGIP